VALQQDEGANENDVASSKDFPLQGVLEWLEYLLLESKEE
jgi:hypothetical protein